MRLSDNWLALIFIALAAAMFGMTMTFPPFPGQKYGPALFPRILSIGIILCALIMMYRARERARKGRPDPALTIDPAMREPGRLISFLIVPGAVIAYLLLAEWLGFIPTCFLILAGLMLWFRVSVVRTLIVAVVMTGLLQWFFGTLMRVPLPRGLFMQLLYGG